MEVSNTEMVSFRVSVVKCNTSWRKRCSFKRFFGLLGSFWATVWRPFVQRFALCYRTVALYVLSVCNVGVLLPNGWMDQDETWHAGRHRLWPHCVRWGRSLFSPKGHSPQNFGPYLLRPNGWMDQDATRHGARPRPRQLCVRWGPRSPSPKSGGKFSAHVYCGQTAGWIKTALGMEIGLSPGDFVLWRPSPLPQNEADLGNGAR